MQVVLRMRAPKELKIWKFHKMCIWIAYPRHPQKLISIKCHPAEIFSDAWKNDHIYMYILYSYLFKKSYCPFNFGNSWRIQTIQHDSVAFTVYGRLRINHLFSKCLQSTTNGVYIYIICIRGIIVHTIMLA